MARVFCAMSGGVDSSVAAALLLEQGHDVTGVTMQLWPSTDEEGGCCSVSAIRDARRVCDLLGIPHYTLNFRDVFEREVVGPFADEYAAGRTPNPCVACNTRVKFGILLPRVAAQGAEYLATGHYARIERDEDGRPWLARGTDRSKDQSYFLYGMTEAHLDHVLFPCGELHKTEVRAFAERFGLPVAEKPESQEICFAPAGHAHAVARLRPDALNPGDIVTKDGTVLGRHAGIARYTVGQRKGIGVSSPDEPLYVVAIDAKANRIVVGAQEDLEVRRVCGDEALWRLGADPERVDVAVRYRMAPRPALAESSGETIEVTFDEPLAGVAPGQSVVCYRGERVVGGGRIAWADS